MLILGTTPGASATTYDGLWTGGGAVDHGDCPGFNIVVSVEDSKVTGKVIVPPENEYKIEGEVTPYGEFRGELTYLWFTVAQLEGRLGAGRAEGRWRTTNGLDCAGGFAVEKN